MGQKPKNVERIVYCCCVLHNMLSVLRKPTYLRVVAEQANPDAPNLDWQDAQNLADLQNCGRNQHKKIAKIVREHLCNYYNGVGKVEWQDRIFD